MNPDSIDLESIILKYKLMDENSLARIKMESLSSGKDIKDLILREGLVTEDALLYALSTEMNLPFVTLTPENIDHSLVKKIPQEVLEGFRFLPMVEIEGEIRVAVADPADEELRKLLTDTYPDREICISVAIASNILDTIDAIFSEAEKPQPARSPAIAIYYAILTEAVKGKASAIYFEPAGEKMRIRVRRNERLIRKGIYPGEFILPIVEKVKETMNTRHSGRGALKTVIAGRDVYISSKLLDSAGNPGAILLLRYPGKAVPLDKLPMEEEPLNRLMAELHKSTGCILVTGGDWQFLTTVTVAILRELNPARRKVIAVLEDDLPVEALEHYINSSAEETNRNLRNLLGAGVDAVYIQDIRRPGIDIEILLQLSTETLVIASLPAGNSRDAMKYMERKSEINLPISVVETTRVPVVCPDCSGINWQRGRGCRRCGYSGVKGYVRKINFITFAEGE